MKQIAGSLRLDLAAFRELEAFAQMGTEVDKATQAQLDRGYRMVEILKQPQFKPMNVIDQVMSIYAGAKGYLDKVPVRQVAAWEEQFLRFMREQKPEVRTTLMKEKRLTWLKGSEAYLQSLRADGVPDAVLAKLQKLVGKSFASKDDFLDAVAKLLTAEELDRYRGKLIQHAEQFPEVVQRLDAAIVAFQQQYQAPG
jgi:hypothetical protein